MNPGELETLCTLIKSVNPRRVIEFGCNVGRTAKVLLREIPSIETYIGIDVPLGYVTPCAVQSKEIPQNPGYLAMDDERFSLLLKERGTWDVTPDELEYADAVFIDGDHSYDAVMNDTILARSIIRQGGIIVWHDYHHLPTVDVRKVLDHLHNTSLTYANMLHVQDTWLAFQLF